ncbi:hypothetical protein S40285_09896 [Stachybotrys chlorohalonatus IBT 40285]|uniref:DUF7962 domain-containing protein n=1 Tax=Stachybotrys chlorohalonatus (strain IBT 40285) TaxID=1283841 RepID=A0A084QR51_STAC4|nr:hypothetical protein S40285_09896 [Stachybotrys chlorohalonata IBT 40285]
MMPRPDVARLGISYRRIPVMTVGRDVYLDTRLQLPKLEALHPSLAKLGAESADQQALQHLLSTMIIDGGVFESAVQLLPTDLPLLQSEAYYKDRSDYIGAKLSPDSMQKRRPEALTKIASSFKFLEATLLSDGRDWILSTESPSLADIEAVWPFHWLIGLPGALPSDTFSEKVYPRVYAWVGRFQAAVSAAKKKLGPPRSLSGEEAARLVAASPFNEEDGSVDVTDAVVLALGLNKGDLVKVWPTDTGASHKDTGRLVSLTETEVVWETATTEGASVRVHAPRHGYRFSKATDDVVRQRL